MEEKFLVGTKLTGNTGIGFSLDKRIAIPTKSIVKIEDGINTDYYQNMIEKCNNEFRIIDSIKRDSYLGTFIYYKDYLHETIQFIHFIENFDECISQL